MSGHHAIIAPSSLDRTVECQAWVGLSKDLPPEPDTEDTLEGNAADWVVKQYAAGNEVAYGTPIPLPGGFKVDHDMIHGAKLWLDVIGYGSVSGVPVVIERIHPTDCWGEPDGWRWDAIDQVLRVPDYKYGFGIIEVFENWQLIAYACGLIDTLGLVDTDIIIEFTIVQPRAHHKDGPVRKWRVRGDKIRGLVNQAHDAAIHALPPAEYQGVIAEPKAKTGPHCLHCPARLVCETYRQGISHVAEFVGKSSLSPTLTPQAVGVELATLHAMQDLLKGRVAALEVKAEALLRAGQLVPFYAMEPGQSHLAWLEDVTPDEVLALGRTLDKPVNLAKPPEKVKINSRASPVVTPTQAIKAGVDRAVILQYATQPKSALKLARVSTTEARKAFGANNA